MRAQALLSGQGSDRVGLADDLSAELARRGLSIEDGRMTALGGQFALIVRIRGEQDGLRALRRELPELSAGLGFELRMGPVEGVAPFDKSPEYRIRCSSQRPDAMNALTGLLKRHQVNIEALEADASPTRWTSGLAFHLTARVTLPPDCSREKLRRELRTLQRERDLDVVITRAPSTSKPRT